MKPPSSAVVQNGANVGAVLQWCSGAVPYRGNALRLHQHHRKECREDLEQNQNHLRPTKEVVNDVLAAFIAQLPNP